MATVECPHVDAPAYGRVCLHLLDSTDIALYQRFTGRGVEYDLVCSACLDDLDGVEHLDSHLRPVCRECFERIAGMGDGENIVGMPEVRERITSLRFQHEPVGHVEGWPHSSSFAHDTPHTGNRDGAAGGAAGDDYWQRRTAALAQPLFGNVLDIQPIEGDSAPSFIALVAGGALVRLDLADHRAFKLAEVESATIDFAENVSLQVSRDGSMVAVTNTYGRHGLVYDVRTGDIVLRLERDDEDCEHSRFPVAFFEHDGHPLLIHGTAWNRLDVSDPASGSVVTERPVLVRQQDHTPKHYLDYFHCALVVSPNQEWVVEDGWVWHPAGAVTLWNLARWIGGNAWESEDGPSKRTLCYRTYFWDGPLCWIGDSQVAVWGYGRDDRRLLPAVRIFDVTTGNELRWFAGPEDVQVPDGTSRSEMSASGEAMPWQRECVFTHDTYLFSCSAPRGTSVWDSDTGERLLHDADFRPIRYHRGAKRFLSVLPDGTFQLSRLLNG